MVFCRGCGKETMPTDKFCHNCGMTLTAPTSNQSLTKETSTPAPSTPIDATVLKPNDRIDHSVGYKNARNVKYIAIITGFFGLCGIAHLYIGQIPKGIGILALSLFLDVSITYASFTSNNIASIAIGIPYLVLWIWHILDAKNKASEFNRVLHETGKQLW